jgi:hypothetical protein
MGPCSVHHKLGIAFIHDGTLFFYAGIVTSHKGATRARTQAREGPRCGGKKHRCPLLPCKQSSCCALRSSRQRPPRTAMSTRQSSNLKSSAPMEETPSTRSSAGWSAASIVCRTLPTSLVTPVVVSLWTTATAFIFFSLSAASTSASAASSAPSPVCTWRMHGANVSACFTQGTPLAEP